MWLCGVVSGRYLSLLYAEEISQAMIILTEVNSPEFTDQTVKTKTAYKCLLPATAISTLTLLSAHLAHSSPHYQLFYSFKPHIMSLIEIAIIILHFTQHLLLVHLSVCLQSGKCLCKEALQVIGSPSYLFIAFIIEWFKKESRKYNQKCFVLYPI